jgi:hypothetical protein
MRDYDALFKEATDLKAETAALPENLRSLENACVQQSAILESTLAALDGDPVSDFMESFVHVRGVLDLRQRAEAAEDNADGLAASLILERGKLLEARQRIEQLEAQKMMIDAELGRALLRIEQLEAGLGRLEPYLTDELKALLAAAPPEGK